MSPKSLWPPCVADADIVFLLCGFIIIIIIIIIIFFFFFFFFLLMAALCNRGHYIFVVWILSFFFLYGRPA